MCCRRRFITIRNYTRKSAYASKKKEEKEEAARMTLTDSERMSEQVIENE